MNERALGTLAGLRLTATRAAVIGSIVLVAIVIGLMAAVFNIPIGSALLGGVIVVILHWFSQLVHHLGHAWAARRTGYPMTGVRFGTYGVLGRSLYPPDEPALPAKVHIRRAIGGPIFSAWLSTIAFLVLLMTIHGASAMWEFVLWFFFLENFLVLTLQVFIPLGFNDGGTIWQWMRKK
jgi:hypothetical protein